MGHLINDYCSETRGELAAKMTNIEFEAYEYVRSDYWLVT
jgi:hypothetical protein